MFSLIVSNSCTMKTFAIGLFSKEKIWVKYQKTRAGFSPNINNLWSIYAKLATTWQNYINAIPVQLNLPKCHFIFRLFLPKGASSPQTFPLSPLSWSPVLEASVFITFESELAAVQGGWKFGIFFFFVQLQKGNHDTVPIRANFYAHSPLKWKNVFHACNLLNANQEFGLYWIL